MGTTLSNWSWGVNVTGRSGTQWAREQGVAPGNKHRPLLQLPCHLCFQEGQRHLPEMGFSVRFSFFVKCKAHSEMSDWELVVGRVLPSLKPTGKGQLMPELRAAPWGMPLHPPDSPQFPPSPCVWSLEGVTLNDSRQHREQWGGPHPLSEWCP